MKGFWNELQRRQIVKSAVAYLVVSWLIIQVLSILFPTFSFSPKALKIVIIFLAILFPVWLIFNWIYEPSSQGLVKTDDTPDDSEGIEKKRISLNRIIIVGLSLAVILLVINTVRLQSKIIRDDDGKSSIAVLYFDNMSADKDNAWISDGMTESISSKLQPIKDLIVSGRTSVKQFKDSKASIPEIAEKLEVNYVLEGSVRVQNNKALITAQLIDRNNQHVWAKDYEVILDDIIKVQNTIAERIVNELRIKLSPKNSDQLTYENTNNLEAYKLFVQGQALKFEGGDNTERAFDLFKRATELDTLYADAYAEMGQITWIFALSGKIDPLKASVKMKEYADKALSINPNTSLAYSILALRLALSDDYDEELYKSYIEKALELNPNDEEASDYLANYYDTRGELNKSIEIMADAVQRSPLSESANWAYITYLIREGSINDAESHFKKTEDLYNKKMKKNIKEKLFLGRARLNNKNERDWTETIKTYEDSIGQYFGKVYINRTLGQIYNGVLNDDINALKHFKLAYELDSTQTFNAMLYAGILSENRMFNEAWELMQSDNYNKIVTGHYKKLWLFYYYYNKGEYDKCFEYFDGVGFSEKLLLYAQLGDLAEINRIYQEYNSSSRDRALVYAILKERDSMYYFLNQNGLDFEEINSQHEFDPYRKDEQYKVLLKKHHLPITHWNE